MTAITLALVFLAGLFALLGLATLIAVIDNRRNYGVWWGKGKGAGVPDPFDPLTGADQDAWYGGGGGVS